MSIAHCYCISFFFNFVLELNYLHNKMHLHVIPFNQYVTNQLLYEENKCNQNFIFLNIRKIVHRTKSIIQNKMTYISMKSISPCVFKNKTIHITNSDFVYIYSILSICIDFIFVNGLQRHAKNLWCNTVSHVDVCVHINQF